MKTVSVPAALRWAGWTITLLALSPGLLAAQDFQPGAVIEYKVPGAVPETWERGVIVRALEGGKQYLIRQKPSQFFPEGPERAYAPGDLRSVTSPQAEPKQPAVADSKQPAEPKQPAVAPDPQQPATAGQGLLSKEDVVAYAKTVFGPGDPFADGTKRDANLNKLRDHIKARGTNFLLDDTFKYKDLPNGMYSVHVGSAIEANYGKAPKLEDYYGTYLLRTTNRGTKTVTKDGSHIVITATDAQYESGALIIEKDGTFVWKVGRTDPQEQWLRGKWRAANADEVQPWEGGPTLVLEKARQNEDYTVRMCRVPGYEGWIDVGMGKGRIAASYGRRP